MTGWSLDCGRQAPSRPVVSLEEKFFMKTDGRRVKSLTQCDSLEIAFPKLFELLTDMVKFRPDVLGLLAVAFLELHGKADSFCDEHIAPFLSVINEYLTANIKSGKRCDLDSTIMTAALTLTTLMHPGVSRSIEVGKPFNVDTREAGRMYARFWLDVLSPRMLT